VIHARASHLGHINSFLGRFFSVSAGSVRFTPISAGSCRYRSGSGRFSSISSRYKADSHRFRPVLAVLSIPPNTRAFSHFWIDSQPNLFSLRCFSHLSCCWLWLLLPLVLVVGSSPSTLSVVGSPPSTISSRLLVHCFQQSRLGSRSTWSSLEHLGHLCSLFICFKLDLYNIYKFQLEGECWSYYAWPMRPKASVGSCTCT
jgi:hypothetical protein